jgi:hypothetical protein
MFVKPSRFPAKDSVSKWELLCFPVLTLALSASTGWAQAPTILVDAQQNIGTGLSGPQGIAISQNGTVYISDTSHNQILALNPKTGGTTPLGSFALSSPTPLALDANGDLYVGDTPSGVGRIVKFAGDGKGNPTATATSYYATTLQNPFALAVDSSGTLFIGDYPGSGNGVIYSLTGNGTIGTTLTALNFNGTIPTQFTPSSLFRSGTNLYIADNGAGQTGIGGVYVAPAAGGNAQKIPTYSFTITNPTGIRRDAAGNIYILSLLTPGAGYNSGQQVIIVPAASPNTPYILPTSGIALGSDMAFDTAGNLDVLDYSNGNVVQLTSVNPVDVGNKNNVGGVGSPVQFNIELNAPNTLRGFQIISQGDVSQELTQASGGNCVNGKHTNLVLAVPPFLPTSLTPA